MLYTLFLKFKKSKTETDLELVEQYRNSQNKIYLGELFQRYTQMVYGICLKYLEDPDKSKDAVMEIFEQLMVDLRSHDIRQFRPWLYQVSKNHCLMKIRKGQFVLEKEEAYKNFKKNFVENDDLSHLYKEQEEKQLELLEKAITELSDEQKECVKLFYLEKKSYKTIEATTKYSLNEIKSHIQNGKRNLKNILLGQKLDE